MVSVRSYALPLIFLCLVSLIYFWGIAPDVTWVGLGEDSPDYVRAAYFFEPAGLGGYPLYITVGWLFERLPTNPYWNLGLLSAVSTVLTSWILFLLVRYLTGRTSLGIVALVVYPSSLLVWSQSVIPEVYTFTTLFIVLGIYLLLRGLTWWSALVLGLGLGTHFLLLLSVPPVLWYLRREGLTLGRVGGFLGLFLLGGIVGLSQYWVVGFDSSRLDLVLGSLGLFGSLPVIPPDPTLERLQEFVLAFFVGPFLVAVLAILPGWKIFFSRGPVPWDNRLILLGALTCIYLLVYLISFPPQWIVYLLPGFAFFIVFYLALFARVYPFSPVSHSCVVIVLALGLLFTNLLLYDIGRSLDPEPTTARKFLDYLDHLPDRSIVYSYTWGHPHVLVESYARFNDGRIVGLTATWEEETRREHCSELGISCPKNIYGGSIPLGYGFEVLDARSLQTLNPDREVWVAYIEDPNTVGFDIIPVGLYTTSLNRIYSGSLDTE